MINQMCCDLRSMGEETVAIRLAPGQQVIMCSDALVVDVSGSTPAFLCISPGKQLQVPEAGTWYAVFTRRFTFAFGLAKLSEYAVEGYPNQHFRLGFFSEMELRVAHIHGFRRLLEPDGKTTCASLFETLRSHIYEAVEAAVRRTLPGRPEYSEILKSQPLLEAAIREDLFRLLLNHGVCLYPGTYRITNFAKPTIVIDL